MRAAATLCALSVLGAVTAGAAHAVGTAASSVECEDDGRELLTLDGLELAFDAPVVTAPELSATRQHTGQRVTTWREAKLPLSVDVAPSASASADMTLSWDGASDFDLYVVDDDGQVIAASDESNIEDDTTQESVGRVRLQHCDQITVLVRSWAGSPAEQLSLDVDLTPGTTLLACAEADPAPGCAGKEAGEAPDAVADTGTRLYLGGDPGQASMVWSQAGTRELPHATLAPDRPTSGVPNQYTRPVVGFRDQLRNPFVPHFTGDFPEPRSVIGTVDALVWVSSPTLSQGGTLHVDLYLDGALAGSVPVPGTAVGTDPTPLHVEFPGVRSTKASSVTLQLGTEPAVSSNGPGESADALFTVHYGGVQFPSRITLP